MITFDGRVTTDCICSPEDRAYGHTTGAGDEISKADLLIIAAMEQCPVEKRAMVRIANEIGRKP